MFDRVFEVDAAREADRVIVCGCDQVPEEGAGRCSYARSVFKTLYVKPRELPWHCEWRLHTLETDYDSDRTWYGIGQNATMV
jgi:hypothetical protein